MSLIPPGFGVRLSSGALVMSLALLFAAAAQAHQPGLSTLAVQVQNTTLAVHLTLARADTERLYPLDADRDGTVTTNEFEAARLTLEELAFQMVSVTGDNKPLSPEDPRVYLDDSDAVHFEFYVPIGGAEQLQLCSAVLSKLPQDHRQYFTAYDTNRTLLGAWLLERKNDSVTLPTGASDQAHERPKTFVEFLKLGVEHIVTGYDHLVFLLGLLIVGGRFVAAVKIITAFTVAHSLTLALATLDLIRLPPAIVEPLIALSIIYVGIENIFRRDLEKRWMLAFGFGLIHGCGFATVLRDLGVGREGGGVIMPLLSFNLGVELGQLVIAALVLPIVWTAKKRPTYQPRFVPAFSVLIAAAGAYWLVERIIGIVRS